MFNIICFIHILVNSNSVRLKDVINKFQEVKLMKQLISSYKSSKSKDPCGSFRCESNSNVLSAPFLGCCHRVIHLNDVMILNGVFIVNERSSISHKSCNNSTSISLPPLIHRFPGPIRTSQLAVKIINNSTLPLLSCKSYFNGTLHVSGRKSIHKLFHLMNDNMLPLMTQIILDLFLAPEYAHLPHMSLAVDDLPLFKSVLQRWTPKGSSMTMANADRWVSYHRQMALMKGPHIQFIKRLFEGGEIDINQANGMCFRRVAWGSGLRIHYADAMVVLRRLTADFARLLAMMTYNPPVPQPFLRISNLSSSMVYDNSSSQSLSRGMLLRENGQPLRVVYLSRGPNGKGRSLTNIDVVLNRLTQSGASVFPCRESYANMTAQLSCVAHADVIIGLHGAALVNAIFAPRGCILVELKTLYGYTTDIFTRTADSREGMYIHIDIRNYSSPHGFHRKLSDRALGNWDMVLSYALYRQIILKGDKMEHCSQCDKEWKRIFLSPFRLQKHGCTQISRIYLPQRHDRGKLSLTHHAVELSIIMAWIKVAIRAQDYTTIVRRKAKLRGSEIQKLQ
eukprot:gene9259-19219_t